MYNDLSYRTPLPKLAKMMRAMAGSDLRVLSNQDITRALLHNGADKIETFALELDTRPWRTFRQRVRDAWDVFRERAVAVHVTKTVYDR